MSSINTGAVLLASSQININRDPLEKNQRIMEISPELRRSIAEVMAKETSIASYCEDYYVCYSSDVPEVKHESELTDWEPVQIEYFCNSLFIYFIDDFDFGVAQ